MDAMANRRKFLKNMAQQIYENEVKNAASNLSLRQGGKFDYLWK
jgi:hypothetical protein